MAGIADLLQPQTQPMPQAPTSEFGSVGEAPAGMQAPNAKRAAWSQLLEDPNMKSALFRTGLQMMQGTRPGEGNVSAVARAGIGAMDYYASKSELDRKKALEERKLKNDERNLDSQIENRTAQTAGQVQQNQENSAKFAEWETQRETRAKTAAQNVKNLELQGKTQEAQLLKSQLELEDAKAYADFIAANPRDAEKARKAKLMKPLFEQRQTEAQTESSRASAVSSYALAKERNQSTSQQKALFDAQPVWIQALDGDEDAVQYAMANKSVKSQSEIEADIRAGKHNNFVARKTSSGGGGFTGGGNEFTGQAESILQEYAAADKKKFPTVDSFINAMYNVSLGKSASGVLSEVKRLQNSPAGGNTSGADVQTRFAADPNTKGFKLGKQTDKGFEVLDSNNKLVGHYD